MMYTIDLEQITALAAERRDEFEILRYQLELIDHLEETELDAWAEGIAGPIRNAIDCTQCANCCRSLDVYLTEADGKRLAAGIDVPLDAILDGYVDRDNAAKVGEWGQFKFRPCAFLNGKLCSVYEHRPDSCREYPAFAPYFRWSMDDTIDGAALCPIIYHTLSAMVAQVDDLYQR